MEIETGKTPLLHHSPRTHTCTTAGTVYGKQVDLGVRTPFDRHSQFTETISAGFQGNSFETDISQTLYFVVERFLTDKSKAFNDITKIGRTHLQDALPIRLGQEFSGYARQVELGIQRIERSLDTLLELTLGGTAVGTKLNVHPDFPGRAIRHMSKKTGLPFRETVNHFEAQGTKDGLVEVSGALKTIAVGLIKIAKKDLKDSDAIMEHLERIKALVGEHGSTERGRREISKELSRLLLR